MISSVHFKEELFRNNFRISYMARAGKHLRPYSKKARFVGHIGSVATLQLCRYSTATDERMCRCSNKTLCTQTDCAVHNLPTLSHSREYLRISFIFLITALIRCIKC